MAVYFFQYAIYSRRFYQFFISISEHLACNYIELPVEFIAKSKITFYCNWLFDVIFDCTRENVVISNIHCSRWPMT